MRARTSAIALAVLALWALSGCNGSDGSSRTSQIQGRLMHVAPSLRPHLSHSRSSAAKPEKESDAMALKKLEAKHRETLARIEAQKAEALRRLQAQEAEKRYAAEQEVARLETGRDIAVEKVRAQNELKRGELDARMHQKYLVAALLALFLLITLLYLMHRRKHELRHRMAKEEREHQAYLHESRLQHERINKMLEIIADERTDKHLKKELTRLLKEHSTPARTAIEHKSG